MKLQTASEDNAELVRPAVSLPPAPSPGWTLTSKLSLVVKDHAVSSHEGYLQFLKDNVVSIPLHSEKLFLTKSVHIGPPTVCVVKSSFTFSRRGSHTEDSASEGANTSVTWT